jgi:hypothetical protein
MCHHGYAQGRMGAWLRHSPTGGDRRLVNNAEGESVVSFAPMRTGCRREVRDRLGVPLRLFGCPVSGHTASYQEGERASEIDPLCICLTDAMAAVLPVCQWQGITGNHWHYQCGSHLARWLLVAAFLPWRLFFILATFFYFDDFGDFS